VLLCAMCGQAMGNFTCSGCDQPFCTRHATEHRQILGREMDAVILNHDQLRQNLTEYGNKPLSHPLMKQIDDWEQESIDKIHQIATESRNQLQHVIVKWKDKITESLEPLTQELKRFHEDDTFVETDLGTWKAKLEKLKNELLEPPTVKVIKEFANISYISKLLVLETPEDIFQELVGNISIEDKGKVITHGYLPSYGAARGKGEYSSGCYQLRFKMEDLSEGQEIFFGIVSGKAAMQSNPSFAPTAYGWTGKNSVFLNGTKHENYRSYQSDMKKNDIFELLIHCDRQKIRLKNTRTGRMHELTIDVDKCPLPWQLNFSLAYWGDRVRLLPP
jgi:hypothetical protein